MKVFFSIIIPTYNRAHSIEIAINSIINQSFQDFEIIIIDDASTDNTEEVVSKINDSRIYYYKNTTNLERCISRNIGIEKSTGEYICFLDSDDFHLPNHFEVLYKNIKENENIPTFYFVNAWNQAENGIRSERYCPDFISSKDSQIDSFTYFLRYTVNPQRWCVHKSIFQTVKFDPNVIICEDMDTSLRICNLGYSIKQIKERTTVYVASEDSFTYGDPLKWEKELFYLKRIFEKKELKNKLEKQEKKRLLSMCYFHLSQKEFKANRYKETIKYLTKSFFLFPKGYNGKTNKIILYSFYKSIVMIFFCLKKNKMKSKIVKYDLPKNYTDIEMAQYFLPIQNCRIKKSKIKLLKNVFINYQGLVLSKGLLIRRCAFNLLGNKDNTFYFPFWKLILEQYLVCLFGKSLKSLKLNEGTFILIHSKWFNYSFWINSYLLRLIEAEEKGLLKDVKLIYLEEWDKIPYVVESLKCFTIKHERIPQDTNLFVKKIIFPETREWTSSFYPFELKKVKDKILPFAIRNGTYNKNIKRLYLTRKNSRARSISNEESLIKILEKYEFDIVSFDEISFWDQVLIMNNLDCFVSIHGAGFSNIIFMQENKSVFELVNKSYADLEYKFPFWKMSVSHKLNYFVQFGLPIRNNSKLVRGSNPKPNDNYLVDENIIIDTNLFESNIKMMIESL